MREGVGFLGKTACECFGGDLLRRPVYWQAGELECVWLGDFFFGDLLFVSFGMTVLG